jgi:RHS repeat-associated protein
MPSHSCSTPADPRHVGDPVDTLTGAVLDRKLEFRLVGPLDLRWYRHYDSSSHQKKMAFGWGHTHDFDRALRFSDSTITYEYPVGRAVEFSRLEKDGDESISSGFVLRRTSAKLYQITRHGEPAMEFELRPSHKLSRLRRLFQGKAQILFQYDDNYCLERIIDSLGRRVRVVEQPDGRVTSLTLEATPDKPALLLAAYEFDARGNLVATKYRDGYGYALEYDKENRLVMQRGRKGFRFFFEYDQMGRCIKASDDGQMYGVTLDYKIPRQLTMVKRDDGGEWAYHFDKAGRLARIVDPLGGKQAFVYDELGKLSMEVDAMGNATNTIYNAAGAAIARIDPLGHRIDLPEDLNAPDPLAHRVPANPAEYSYGRLLERKNVSLPSQEQAMGLPWPRQASSLVFAKNGTEENPPEGEISSVQPLSVIWWPKPRTGRIFNDFGKLIGQRDEFGRRRQWTYDASENVADQVDFDGSKWLYDHGAWHLLRGLTDPLGGQVRLSYGVNEQVTSITDAGGARSEYVYNLSDQLVEVRRHGVVRDKYVRDAAGNMIAKHASDGRLLLQFEIGPGNLRTKRILASGDEHTFKYDKSGRRVMAGTKKDAVEFAYDVFGNCSQDKRNGQGVEHIYFFDRLPGASVFFKNYQVKHEGGRDGTFAITDPGGKKHLLRVLPNGLVEQQFSNGSREFAQYDGQGRCLFKYVERQRGESWKRRYHWSGEGELRRVEDNINGEVRHEYDPAHRLRRRILPRGKTENYELDPAGNLLSQPGLEGTGLDQGNRLRSANGESFQYNDRNHIAARQTSAGPVRYAYDSRDQLIGVETPHGPWTADYDAQGRRSRKTWAGQTTEYYWYMDQLAAEVHADGSLRLYIYADGLAQTPMLFLDYDSVTSPPESGRRYFIFSDQVGAPCLVEDESGTEVWRAAIGPYGNAQVAPGAKIEFNLRFPGHYFDAELGLHYNRYRYYSPAWGRYLQSDPWGIAGGYNLYAYCANPLLKADVRGLGADENCAKNKQIEDEETTTAGVNDREAVAEMAKQAGIYPDVMESMQLHCMENGELLVMRDTKEACMPYQNDPENYAPKPHDCLLKCNPESGLVEQPAEPYAEGSTGAQNEQDLKAKGYTVYDSNGRVLDPDGKALYGDHDMQGWYKQNPDGTFSNPDPSQAVGENDANRENLNRDMGSPPGPEMIQHGANDDYRNPDGSIGRRPGSDLNGNFAKDEAFTAINPDGSVTRINSIEALKAFYANRGIDWPYGADWPPKCPVGK